MWMMWKIDKCVLEEKLPFKILGIPFCSNLYWGSYIASIAKAVHQKLEIWLVLWSVFLVMLPPL